MRSWRLLLAALALSTALSSASASGIPIGPTGSGGGGETSLNGPGYTAGVWYIPPGTVSKGTGVGVASITTAYCTAWWVGNIASAGDGSATLTQIAGSVSTAGTTTAQFGIYANDSTAVPYRPGAFVGNTNAVSTTSGQPITTLSVSVIISANTLYWLCLQAGDTTLRYNPQATSTTGQNPYLALVGTTAVGFFGSGGSAPINGVSTSTGVTSYGTWPATFHGATFTDTALAPWFGFNFVSVP